MLHIRVVDESGEEIAQRFLAVHKLQAGRRASGKRNFRHARASSGYRHIILRNRANRSEGPASVFVRIAVRIYSPSYQERLREQFANPLKMKKEHIAEREAFANPIGHSNNYKRMPTGEQSKD